MSELMEAVENLDKAKYNKYVNDIKRDSSVIVKRFCSIASRLLAIKEEKLYLCGSYSSFLEFAETEFGYKKTTVYSLLGIANRFIDTAGKLLPEYQDYTYKQLEEMLSMSDDEMENVNPDMTVKEIKEKKKELKEDIQEPEQVQNEDDNKDVDLQSDDNEMDNEYMEKDFNGLAVNDKNDLRKYLIDTFKILRHMDDDFAKGQINLIRFIIDVYYKEDIQKLCSTIIVDGDSHQYGDVKKFRYKLIQFLEEKKHENESNAGYKAAMDIVIGILFDDEWRF